MSPVRSGSMYGRAVRSEIPVARLGCFEYATCVVWFDFFFQAEDGIRDLTVTGVQTCALPICRRALRPSVHDDRHRAARAFQQPIAFWTAPAAVRGARLRVVADDGAHRARPGRVAEIGRASCRERV